MSHNTFGHLFRVTTWGESHGSALGCVVDGMPPSIQFSENEIQAHLNRRKPGSSPFVTQRQESDKIHILSGCVFDKEKNCLITTGTPIAMMIKNEDVRSQDYNETQGYRPGHADYSYDAKYGIRDYRGGGRSSARETALRVASGALARKILPNVKLYGALVAIGEKEIKRENWDWDFLKRDDNPFFTPDPASVSVFADYLDKIRREGSSVGAVVEIIAENVPVGLGAPIYGKLDQDIASNIMSINAVKGVEIGKGFQSSRMRGEENVDEMRRGEDGHPLFLSNNAGGILGGISTGQPILVRFAVKPSSSLQKKQRSINKKGENTEVITEGRHDPCVGIRAVPVGEAMVACALADHYLRHRGQIGCV